MGGASPDHGRHGGKHKIKGAYTEKISSKLSTGHHPGHLILSARGGKAASLTEPRIVV
jgi:hypothetical protein